MKSPKRKWNVYNERHKCVLCNVETTIALRMIIALELVMLLSLSFGPQ